MSVLVMLFVLFIAEPVDYLAIVPDHLASELAPLLAWREGQGHRVRTVAPASLAGAPGSPVTAEAVKVEVAREYHEGNKRLKFLLLVGDVGDQGVPTFLPDHYRWMSRDEPRMATDLLYSDLEGDLLPEIAVGRLPVKTPDQLKKVVEKILRFEKTPLDPAKGLKISLLGGASGYSPAVDRFIESFSRRMLDNFLPQRYDLDVIFANLPSPYCPPPDKIGEYFARSFNGEPAYTVFMGHGSKSTCFAMNWTRGKISMGCGFVKEQLPLIRDDSASGPLFCFSCDNGFFDDKENCLAEEFLLHGGGPVAVIASSRYSHPLPNLYSAQALLESIDQSSTVGELVNLMKIRGYKRSNPLTDMILKNAEGSLEEEINVARLKEDQLSLFNLLGDPATRVAAPGALPLKVVQKTEDPDLYLEIDSPFMEADGYAALCRLRTWEPKKRALPDVETAEGEWRAVKKELFDQVNDKEVYRLPLAGVPNGLALTNHPVLSDAVLTSMEPGKYRLIVYLSTAEEDSAGAIMVEIPMKKKE